MLFLLKFIAVFYLAEILAIPHDDANGRLTCSPNDIIDPKDTTHGEYIYLGKLGSGSAAVVFEVELKDKKGVKKAMKINDINRNTARNTVNELRITDALRGLKTSEHFLIDIFYTFKFLNHICFVSEIHGPSVFDELSENDYKAFPLNNIRHIAHQACVAVKYLHDNHIIHKDIKLSNFLFADPNYRKNSVYTSEGYFEVRLGDYGISDFDYDYDSSELQFEKSEEVQMIGFLIVRLHDHNVYALLSETDDEEDYLYYLERYLNELPKDLAHYKEFLQKLLEYDNNKRITLDEALKDKFFKGLSSPHQ